MRRSMFTRELQFKSYFEDLRLKVRYDQVTQNIFLAKTITATWTWRPYASWATGNRSVCMQALQTSDEQHIHREKPTPERRSSAGRRGNHNDEPPANSFIKLNRCRHVNKLNRSQDVRRYIRNTYWKKIRLCLQFFSLPSDSIFLQKIIWKEKKVIK